MSRHRKFLAVAGAVSAVTLWQKLIRPVVRGLGNYIEDDEPPCLPGPSARDYWNGW